MANGDTPVAVTVQGKQTAISGESLGQFVRPPLGGKPSIQVGVGVQGSSDDGQGVVAQSTNGTALTASSQAGWAIEATGVGGRAIAGGLDQVQPAARRLVR